MKLFKRVKTNRSRSLNFFTLKVLARAMRVALTHSKYSTKAKSGDMTFKSRDLRSLMMLRTRKSTI